MKTSTKICLMVVALVFAGAVFWNGARTVKWAKEQRAQLESVSHE